MNILRAISAACGLVLAIPSTASAALLTFQGQLHLDTPAAPPVANARVTVTFYGHEEGIHEYTTQRSARTVTAADGSFSVQVKLSEYRYQWTHARVAIASTDISKERVMTGTCARNGVEGCTVTKRLEVMPLGASLAAALTAARWG